MGEGRLLRAALLAVALPICSAGAGAGAGEGGVGFAVGDARASYDLTSAGSPALSDYDADGYSQRVTRVPGGWSLEVRVELAPLLVREPFRAREKALPSYIGGEGRKALAGALGRCQRQGEAVEAVLLHFRRSLSYAERPPFAEEPAEVVRRGQASCVGMVRACLDVLRSQGVSCREVMGLRAPQKEGPATLRGGMLHAWIEVEFPGAGRVFFDPWRTCGWVPETYIVLRVGGGLEPAGFSALTGGELAVRERRDRVFFEPAPGRACVLWSRPGREAYTGTLLTGKVLGPGDEPLAGRAALRGQGSEVAMDLWEGNFFFRDLEPGTYGLRLEAPGVPPEEAEIALAPMDKRRILVYSRDGRKRGTDGAGRQP